MKLKDFIGYLQIIQKTCDEDVEVLMADFTPVVEPVLLNSRGECQYVAITDEK